MKRIADRGFTLVELLVVIGIIAVLISVLLPALNSARQSAEMIKCLSNIRQLSTYAILYSTESKGAALPWAAGTTASSRNLNGPFWHHTLATKYMKWDGQNTDTYLSKISEYFVCPTVLQGPLPTSPNGHYRSYMINGYVSGFYDLSKAPPAGQKNGWGNGETSYPAGRNMNFGDNPADLNNTKAYPVKVTRFKQSAKVMQFVEQVTLFNFSSNLSENGVRFRGWRVGSGVKGDADIVHKVKRKSAINSSPLGSGIVNIGFLDGHAESVLWDRPVQGQSPPDVIADPTDMD